MNKQGSEQTIVEMGGQRMIEMLVVAGAIGLTGAITYAVRRARWLKREQRILYKKYGDLPMFEDFFQRMHNERQRNGEKLS